jgi:mannose-1-phosphate guanylyltransferase
VGDFSSLADLLPAEVDQPRILGDSGLGACACYDSGGSAHGSSTVVTDQSAGGIVVPASGRLVACLGVDDLVVVDTSDALLITTRARSQEVNMFFYSHDCDSLGTYYQVKRLVAKCREGGWKSTL